MAKKLVIFVLISLGIISMNLTGNRLDSVRKSAENHQKSCIARIGQLTLQNKGRQNYCICVRDYLENVNAPHSIVDRVTFGYFWSKQEALEEYSGQLARCESGKYTN
ncbi:MAG: hypothetical protein V7459_07085 [Oceanicoccus sp.]